MTTMDIHTLAGAYALHALDDQEAAAFTRHIAGCEPCAVEVAELRETTARLAGSTAAAPPPRLKTTVTQRIHVTRQEAPGRALTAPRRVIPHWRRRATTALVAASFIAVAGVATVLGVRAQQAAEERARITAVLSAPDAALRTSTLQTGGTLTVVTSATRDTAVVVITGARPAADRALQMWLLQGTEPASAAVLAAGQGEATLLVTGLRGRDAIGITLEPPGGSPRPTTPVLALIPLT